MQQVILLVIGLPFISALVVQLLNPRLGRQVAKISVIMAWLVFLGSVMALWQALSGSAVREYALFSDWGIIRFDALGSLMCVVISAISLIVHVYSVRYMAEEPGYGRFFSLLDAMTGTLLLMVSAGDLISLLIAWHMVGVFLYFLLGYDIRNMPAQRYAMWTWMTYRLGDIPLILAAALLYQTFGSWSLSVIFDGMAGID